MLIKTEDLEDTYDYIIVGSGITGMTLLRELIERNKSNILIIESGSMQSKSAYPDFMKVKSKNIKTKSRFSGVGGASNVWGSLSALFDKEQINAFHKTKNFPFNYDTYLKYIKEATKYGFPEPDNFALPNSNYENLKFKKFIQITPNIRFYNFSSLLESSKVHFLQNTIVQTIQENKVLFMGESQRKIFSAATEKIILCANTIENIKVLSRSDLDIEKNSLGKGFMNHPKGVIGSIKKTQELDDIIPVIGHNEVSYQGIQLKSSKYRHYLKVTEGFRIPIVEKMTRLFDGDSKFYKGCFSGTSGKILSYQKLWVVKALKIFTRIINKVFKNYYYLEAFTEMGGHKENEIKYNKNNNITEVTYDLSSAELDSLDNLITEFEREFNTKILFKPPNLSKLKKIVSNDASHHMGGISCGNDKSSSIVGLDLKLHNYESIYVCGGGIFPFSGVSNPTLSYIALTIWLAEEIL